MESGAEEDSSPDEEDGSLEELEVLEEDGAELDTEELEEEDELLSFLEEHPAKAPARTHTAKIAARVRLTVKYIMK